MPRRLRIVAQHWSAELSTTSTTAPAARLWPLLLVVNGGWIAFLVAAHTVLPESIGDSRGWPRAVARVGVLLIPSLVYLAKNSHGPWAARMGLVANCRRGLLVGIAVSSLWFAPQFITRWTSGQPFGAPDLTAGIWLNAIVGSPFAEELLYRQIVFQNLSQRLPLWKAVGVSSVWFTVLHVPAAITTTTPTELLPYLAVMLAYGVVFACVYSLAKSLWGSVIPHVVNNVFYSVVAGQ